MRMMTNFIKDLFLHFFIMMIIPLVHNLLSKQRNEKEYRITFIAITLLTIWLTMLFPVKIGPGLVFDFKFIPIFTAFFYGGPLIAFLGILLMIIIDAFTNDTNILILALNYVIISVPFFYFIKRYRTYSLPKKLSLGFLFYLVISVTRFFIVFKAGHIDFSVYMLLFSAVSYLTLAFIIYLIEINDLQLFFMERLQQAEKLNSISQLAASVAHEIRNPMTTIRGFMQLLKDEKNLTGNQNMFVTVSLEELDRTQAIIDDFLSLARPNSTEYEIINISLHLKDIVDFMRPYGIISGIDILCEAEEDLTIKGSLHEFKQLIINLLKNGIEAMTNNSGKVSVTAKKDCLNNLVIITVEDEGVGLSKEQIKQLGQPYYSTKSKGTGLGLMISFDIIKRMNGNVIINSTENKGTIFRLTFPIQ
jgi:two-component system sporulation sensor kinase B